MSYDKCQPNNDGGEKEIKKEKNLNAYNFQPLI